METLLLAGFLSLLIGAILGLLGGGGGILAVPVLTYLLGFGAKEAIASSLLLVGVTSLFGVAVQAPRGRVQWKLGGTFAAVSMAGAFLGGRLAEFVPEHLLLGGLGFIMLLTGSAMLRDGEEPSGYARPLALGRVLGLGAAVGTVSGLVGAGGGFLIVPALTVLAGLAMREAIATSLFIIGLQSFAGFAGHITHVELDFQLLAMMTGSAVAGMVIGSGLSKHISGECLKRAFAGLVIVTGLFVLWREVALAWAALAAVLALAIAIAILRRNRAQQSPESLERKCIISPHLPH
jgi:uncharacterized membrane protein YfcA